MDHEERVKENPLQRSERKCVPSKRIELSKDSWVELFHRVIFTSPEDVQGLLEQCPKVRDKIRMYGKMLEIPRFQRLYGTENYRYSGMDLVAEQEIPTLVQGCLDYARMNYPEATWNGALVNWYMDGMQNVGPHGDDERGLVPDVPILSFSFLASRKFRIKPNKRFTGVSYLDKGNLDIETGDYQLIVMGGSMQREFTHEIVKVKSFVGPRINITVRAFKSSKRPATEIERGMEKRIKE